MPEVVIVGGGIAGLVCARHLHEAGVEVLLLEASDAVGDPLRTDRVEGFRLDRGFHVLLTATPEARRLLDYEALDLRTFESGALVRREGRFRQVFDPWRRPLAGLESSALGHLGDQLRALRLRSRVTAGPLEALWRRGEVTVREALDVEGFSDAFVEGFFRPFLGALCLDRGLGTSSRVFDFYLRMLAQGDAAIPAGGMAEIPAQLLRSLPPECVRTGAAVLSIQSDGVSLRGGERIAARRIVLATEPAETERLVELRGGDTLAVRALHGRYGVTCLYFAAPEPPVQEPMLVLDGEGTGPVNHLCVPTQVASEYGPGGSALVSASVLAQPSSPEEGAALMGAVRAQLTDWFGAQVAQWTHLRTYVLRNVLPDQSPGRLDPDAGPAWVGPGLLVCSGEREGGGLQGALASGRRAAEVLLEEALSSRA
ncbi:MAG TPA: NAD(P)/FAD-dependent oxidoreductase [Candidatus Polarisedimenticolaceae bacterium]|nr:NAD(P)/FAD-dependent oxidoreductase [Candidatus Polarisedimenticolaceae bacterium]